MKLLIILAQQVSIAFTGACKLETTAY